MDHNSVISHVATTTADLSIFGLIASADLISKLVMIMLVILSVWCWTIIFDKLFKYTIIKHKIKNFEEIFWSGQPLEQLFDRVKRAVDNPLAAIFVAAMNEVKRNSSNKSLDPAIKVGQKERLYQAMNLVRNREVERLESYLGVLASIGSYSPFIGLFGTVWGIMNSFQSIAASKNTSLAVVAPGIAEALLATAIGLLAAIPAVAFYNYLASKANFINNRMDDFITELHTILSRSIDEEQI